MVVDAATAQMITGRLAEGQRVALVALNWQHASWAQQDIMEALDDADLTAGARSKRGQIQLGDGRLTFHPISQPSALRGMSLDAIYLPQPVLDAGGDTLADILPTLNARNGIMLGYAL